MRKLRNVKCRFYSVYCLLFTIGLSGCASTANVDPSFVAERWSKTLEAFNIDAVYPPRYMQPGDVFLITETKNGASNDENRYRRRSVRLGRADVTKYLKADAELNLQLPLTTETSPTKDIYTYPGKTVRLQSMGFTGFNISSVRESDIGLTSPTGAFKSLFGLVKRNNLVMSISVPRAEHLEIPAYDAYVAFTEFCNAPSSFATSKCLVKDNDALALALKSIALHDDVLLQADLSSQNSDSTRDKVETIPKIAFVTQVYYARQIDYYYGTNQGTAFTSSAALITQPDSVAASTPNTKPLETKQATSAVATTTPPLIATTTTNVFSTSTVATVAPATSTTSGTTNAPGTSTKATVDSAATDLAKAEALAVELQKRIDDMQSKLNGIEQGGVLRVVRATSEGALLRQTFETPVAIGFRALWWSPLEPKKGEK